MKNSIIIATDISCGFPMEPCGFPMEPYGFHIEPNWLSDMLAFYDVRYFLNRSFLGRVPNKCLELSFTRLVLEVWDDWNDKDSKGIGDIYVQYTYSMHIW